MSAYKAWSHHRVYSLRLSESAPQPLWLPHALVSSQGWGSGGLGVWGPGACIAAFCESLLPGLQMVPPHRVLPRQRPSKPGVSSLAYRDASFLRLRPHPVGHSAFITSSGPASILVTLEVGASTCGFWGHCQPESGVGDSQWIART